MRGVNFMVLGVLKLPRINVPLHELPLFVPATGGLDVDAIPNEITTRIILDSSKASILAQAINISAKGVK
jgi:hypothetical protein